MHNKNYINIQGWMINDLELKGNELILFALIYGFSQDGESEFYGSIRYIMRFLNLSNPTVQKLLNNLVYKKLIQRTSESHYKVYKKVIQGVQESYTPSVQESYTNNNNTNNNTNNNLAKASFAGKEINEVMDEFKKLNPLFNFGNTTQRKATEELLKKFGKENLIAMIQKYIKEVSSNKYVPKASTPYQFKSKLGDIALHFKNSNNGSIGSRIIEADK